MKTLLTTLFVVRCLFLMAQPPCGASPVAGNTCATATPICDLNGYCGNTSASYTANYWSQLNTVFCGSIENNSFLSFVASSTTISYDVWINSTTYGYGIQIMVFSANNCSGAVTSYGCWNPGSASAGPVTVTNSGLTIGNTYYIMIDGNAGDVCSYTIQGTSGFSVPVNVTPANPSICAGSSMNLTAAGGNGTYNWNPSPDLNTTSGANVTVTPPATPGTYTYTVISTSPNPACPSNSADATVTVTPAPVVNAGNYSAVCADAPNIALAGSPVGGTFSGTGVTGSTFDPSAGSQTVTYTYTDGIGCTISDQTLININPLPTVNAGTYTPVCVDGNDVSLSGTPAGGTFSGTGVSGINFDPSVGTQTVTYSYTDGNGCSNSASTQIQVNPLPVVSAGTYPAVCIDATPVTLIGSPTGGTFSGTGVSGNTFDPSSGTQTITYTYDDGTGCIVQSQTTINVNPLPTVSAGSYSAACIDAPNINLAGTPVGGTFSGTGVSGMSFDPSAGTQTVTYTYTNGNGCTNSNTATINVNSLPVVSAGTYTPVCVDAADVPLAGTPSGGTFSGSGVNGNNFDPSIGTQTVTYTYTDGNSCTNSATAQIIVNNLPTVSAGNYTAQCINNSAVVLSGTPAGGVFSGTGVNAGTFNPASGTQTLTYNYTDANGCSNSAQTVINVNPLPIVNAGSYSPVCIDAADVSLAGTPVGGSFSGSGVTGFNFDPSGGTQSVTYTYTDGNGCTNSSNSQITVNPLPIINAGPDATICTNQSVTLSGSPANGMTYVWNNGGINGQAITPALGNTTFAVTGTDLNGCSSSDTITITVITVPQADFYADVTSGFVDLDVVFTNLSSEATSYSWNFGNGSTSNSSNLNLNVNYQDIGVYPVILTASNGYCSDTAMLHINILPYPDAIYKVPNVFTPNGDGSNDHFFIELTYAKSLEVIILNRWGNVMAEYNDVNGFWNGLNKSGNEAEPGVYFFKYSIVDLNNKQIDGHGHVTLIR